MSRYTVLGFLGAWVVYGMGRARGARDAHSAFARGFMEGTLKARRR